MRIVVYPGSFDPITNGHFNVIERANRVFDKVYVIVSNNPDKKYLFDLETRLEIIKDSLNGLEGVEVIALEDELLATKAKSLGACAIVRGLRNSDDFGYETQMAQANKFIGDIDTIYLGTDEMFSFISSSVVREILDLGGDCSEMVPFDITKYYKK